MVRQRRSSSDCAEPVCNEKLLDTLLQTLYDVGEKEDETEQKKIQKKRENRKTDGVAEAVAGETSLSGSFTRNQKTNASSFFRELREELNCAPVVTSHDPPSRAKVPAATGSSPLQNNRDQVQVVEFHSKNKKRKPKRDQDECIKMVQIHLAEKPEEAFLFITLETKISITEKDTDIQEFNLEKARLEVHRFGITGYGKGKERVLERERAIMLGAKPPKNSYVNYKVLQDQIKEKKAAKEEEKRVAQNADIFKKKKRRGQEDRKSKKKKKAPSILSSARAGQVGKFKNGTLILSPLDIKKINSSRVAK